ncbi:MAG: imidazole glycerol phosphate synthase subunit HisH, partial [Clostridia bacterium]|nr:imidazole glycerol phosphate synthase subunit HisH [Clostridia bacterium]
MVAIVDYGVGNLFSLKCSLAYIGCDAVITDSPEVLHEADNIILPGVGAFGDAAAKLRSGGLDKAVISEAEAGKPLLGICLGMQLLFDESLEFGVHKGLGLIPGKVKPLYDMPGWDNRLKIPHI